MIIIHMSSADNNDNGNKVLATINWNNIVNQDARSTDDAPLGKIQGLFEPFVVTEKGTITKEKYYIPKSLIERYDREILYFGITEQEANVICRHDTPPSDDKTKQIQTVTENLIASRKRHELTTMPGEKKQQYEENESEYQKQDDNDISATDQNQSLEKRSTTAITTAASILKPEVNQEEIVRKLKHAASEFKDMIVTGANFAKDKIKEQQESAEEKKAEKDSEKISKMGDLAVKFSSSFDDILSEISSRTYEEQEHIYKGFIKLLDQQRELVTSRKDLAIKLKSSVQKPPASANPYLTEEPEKENKQLAKESQSYKTTSSDTATTASTAEVPSTEIPSAEISKWKKATATADRHRTKSDKVRKKEKRKGEE
jgi:hypothetical protein